MADIRINSLPTTASASSSDDFIAIDGTTNGTRKLNAYSPTFGGNLTVSGTVTATGAITGSNNTNAAKSGFFFNRNGGDYAGIRIGQISYDTDQKAASEFYSDSTNGARIIMRNNAGSGMIDLVGETGAATLGGNLTVSGTGTSSFGGLVKATGNAATSFGVEIANGAGGSGTAQYYLTAGNGAGFTAFRLLRGNGAAGYEDNGFNADCFTGARFNLNALGGSGGNFIISGGNLTVSGTGTSSFNKGSSGTAVTFLSGNNSNYLDIGIGRAAVEHYLAVAASAGNYVSGSAAGDYVILGANGSNILLGIGGTEKARLTSGGNLLVGTTTDGGQKLQVNGGSKFIHSVAEDQFNFYNNASAPAYSVLLRLRQVNTSADAPSTYLIYADVQNGGSAGIKFAVTESGKVKMPALPTSSAGLSAGDLWNDSGTLKIA
jgi:hypothetical protein